MTIKRIEINDIQRALVITNGRLETILGPGRHWIFRPFAEVRVLAFDVNRLELSTEWKDVLVREHPGLVEKHFSVADVSDRQIGLAYQDGKFLRLVSPGQKVLFWKVLKEIKIEYVDFSDFQEIPADKAKVIVDKAPHSSELYHKLVPEGSAGLLLVDGRHVKTVAPGAYTYWKGRASIELIPVDMRIQNMEVVGQEILTKDKVSLRLNFEAFYRVADAAKILAIKDLRDYLHKEFQFALRQALGTRTLDEVLARKESLGGEVTAAVKDKALALGVEIVATGVKDVILPGDIREILNEVVAAEKQAQANLIRRREEVAATRSLLNTAKIIESNPVLMRLKEMEALEKMSEKVQTLNMIAGSEGILKMLGK